MGLRQHLRPLRKYPRLYGVKTTRFKDKFRNSLGYQIYHYISINKLLHRAKLCQITPSCQTLSNYSIVPNFASCQTLSNYSIVPNCVKLLHCAKLCQITPSCQTLSNYSIVPNFVYSIVPNFVKLLHRAKRCQIIALEMSINMRCYRIKLIYRKI